MQVKHETNRNRKNRNGRNIKTRFLSLRAKKIIKAYAGMVTVLRPLFCRSLPVVSPFSARCLPVTCPFLARFSPVHGKISFSVSICVFLCVRAKFYSIRSRGGEVPRFTGKSPPCSFAIRNGTTLFVNKCNTISKT